MRVRLSVMRIEVDVDRCRSVRTKHAPLLFHARATFDPRVWIAAQAGKPGDIDRIAIWRSRRVFKGLRVAERQSAVAVVSIAEAPEHRIAVVIDARSRATERSPGYCPRRAKQVRTAFATTPAEKSARARYGRCCGRGWNRNVGRVIGKDPSALSGKY